MRVSKISGLILSLATGLLILAGCGGGSSSGGSCTTDKDCNKGNICVSNTCQAVKCSTTADCPSGVCDPQTGTCTPRECTLDKDCGGANMYCDNGLCKPKTVGGDIVVTDLPQGDVQADGTTTDTGGPVVKGDDCKKCDSNADCSDGYDCITLSAGGKFCLKKCKTAGDCISGYVCYAASTSGKNCVPPSYKCVECATKGCPSGKVCDLSNGSCKDKVATCQPCSLDWECGIGNRCYRKDPNAKGVCMPECKSASDCPQPQAKFKCQANQDGVQMCQPVDMGACCPADKPHMLPDGTCAQCANAGDCPNGQVCDEKTHTCSSSGCPTGQKLCSDDNQCHQCCEKADCASGQDCKNHTCVGGGQDQCNGACTDPNYKYCVNYQGNWTCAACDPNDSSSCPTGCTCSPTSFNCLNPDGSMCGQKGGTNPAQCKCSADTDCVDPNGQNQLKCTGGQSGYCYDPNGSCDGQNTCCDAASGSKCFDMMSLLLGGLTGGGGGIPGLPGGGGGGTPGAMMGVCSCDNGAKCPGGITCFPLSTICALPMIGSTICPGGQLPPNAPKNICKDPSTLLSGLGI